MMVKYLEPMFAENDLRSRIVVEAFQPSTRNYHMILKVLRTCVPGKSSLALLIMMFVHEDLRSSAIVSPPFPMMWPETLLKNEIQRSRSDQIHALLTAQYIRF